MSDKATWGAGPWQDEPDYKKWTDEATGLECQVRRGPGGHWCGYVAVKPDHPLHGKGYSDTVPWRPEYAERTVDTGPIPLFCLAGRDVETEGLPLDVYFHVHEGLTFAGKREDKGLWWFGFDCAHSEDFTPEFAARMPEMQWRGEYRDLAFVERECTRLAKQLHDFAAEPPND